MTPPAKGGGERDLYAELKAAGCEIDNHESDLYVRSTPHSERIVYQSGPAAYWSSFPARRFMSNLDGKLWIEVPFAFTPFWDARAGREARNG